MMSSWFRVLTFAAVAAAAIDFSLVGGSLVLAQTTAGSSTPTVEDLLYRMDAMQRELDYLREQSAEAQSAEARGASSEPQIRFASVAGNHAESSSHGNGCPRCAGACGCGQRRAARGNYPTVSMLNPCSNVKVFGEFKLDMLLNDARAISPGTPYYLLPDSPAGLSQSTSDIHARQSSFGAMFTGPQVGDFQVGGMFLAFLYNDNAFADAYGILPAQAWGDLRNENWRFAAGYQFDVFNPNAPTILPFSILLGSGNSGNAFRGQLRVERFIRPSDDAQWTIQMALSEPITSVIDPAFRISEDNGWPNIEGRLALGLGSLDGQGPDAKRPLEVGVSGVVGQLRNTAVNANNLTINRFVTDVWGIGADFRWQVTDFLGLMGEFYTGEGLGTYNGAALQLVNPELGFQGIGSTGGWLELFVYWTPSVHSHFGYGIDDPRNGDVPFASQLLGRVENNTLYGNVIWDVTETLRVAFEVSRRETDYLNPIVPDNEGMFFHTQFALRF